MESMRVRVERLLAGLAATLVVIAADATLYKWVDEKGRVQYSDKPPADKSKGGVEMSNRGIVMKKLEAGMSPEQKKAKEDEAARKKAEDQQSADQRRLDNALLQSFTNEHEIDMKRDREVLTLDSIIVNLRNQDRTVTERLADDRRRADSYGKRNKPLPDSVKEDLASSKSEVKVIRDEIERRHQEILDTRNKYEALKKRYVELRQQERAGLIPPPGTAAQAPAKK
jgi:hypothetical protein